MSTYYFAGNFRKPSENMIATYILEAEFEFVY
jgi:hypothetical protein